MARLLVIECHVFWEKNDFWLFKKLISKKSPETRQKFHSYQKPPSFMKLFYSPPTGISKARACQNSLKILRPSWVEPCQVEAALLRPCIKPKRKAECPSIHQGPSLEIALVKRKLYRLLHSVIHPTASFCVDYSLLTASSKRVPFFLFCSLIFAVFPNMDFYGYSSVSQPTYFEVNGVTYNTWWIR